MEARKDVTIRDVAREADVSIATVSRVLNQSSNVADETRARVLNVIEELGYVPSAAAKQLADAGSRRGDDAEIESPGVERIAPSLTFEGAWTRHERRAMADAVAGYAGDGLWVAVKTTPGNDRLYALMELRDGDWTIRTGETVQKLVEQIRSETR